MGLMAKLDIQRERIKNEEGIISINNSIMLQNYQNEIFGTNFQKQNTRPDDNPRKTFVEGYVQGFKTEIRPAVNESKQAKMLNE